MQKNKKSGKRIENVGIIIAAVLCYVLGFTCVIFAMLGEEWEVSRTGQILLGIVGVAAMLLFIFSVYRYLTLYISSHKDWEVEEKDERNEMIRGKVAKQCDFIMSFLLLAVTLILIVCKQWLAVTLLCIIEYVEMSLRVFLFAYYDKKY